MYQGIQWEKKTSDDGTDFIVMTIGNPFGMSRQEYQAMFDAVCKEWGTDLIQIKQVSRIEEGPTHIDGLNGGK